jgi:membrane protease YdiL (CAAX protease family)
VNNEDESFDVDLSTAVAFAPGWYPDPWSIAPWRWWNGTEWTPGLYGPYGEAWPIPAPAPFVAKGPGIKGGDFAIIGASFGVVGSLALSIIFLVAFGKSWVTGGNYWYVLASEIPLWAGFLGAVVIASKKNGSGNVAVDYGLSWPHWKDVWTGVAGGVVGRIWPLLIAVLAILASGESLSQQSSTGPQIIGVSPSSLSGWIVMIFLTVIGAPIVEELFFRGLVQGALTRRVGAIPALFITALGFAFIHISDEGLLAPVVLFPMALILGYLRRRTGRLAPGIVAHATFNATILLMFLIPAFR